MKRKTAYISLFFIFCVSCTPPPGYVRPSSTSITAGYTPSANIAKQADPGGVRNRIISTAQSLLGTPYRFGGSKPGGFDCSGFVYYVYGENDISIPRATSEQYLKGRRISKSGLRAGDLVFYQTYRMGISHVGIYAGGGRFIHAPRTGKNVEYTRMDNPYWKKRFRGAVTYL